MINAENICEELHKRRGKHRHAPDINDRYYANFLSLIKLDVVVYRSPRLSQIAKSSNTHKVSKCNKSIRDVQEMRQSHHKRQQVNSTNKEEVNNSISVNKQNAKCKQEIELHHSWDDIILGMHAKENDTKQLHKVNASNTYRYERSASYDPSYYAESSNTSVGSTISNKIKTKKCKSITNNAKATVCTNASSASIASSAGLTAVHDDEDSDVTFLNEEYSQYNRKKEEEEEEQHHQHELSEETNSATHFDNYNKELEFDYLQSKLNYHKMLNVFTTSFSSSTSPEWKELHSGRKQTNTNKHHAFAHNKERTTNNVVTTYAKGSERTKDAYMREHNKYQKKDVNTNDKNTSVVIKSEDSLPHETSVKVERTVDVIRTPMSSIKPSLHKEKPSKVSSTNNTDHDNDSLDKNKNQVAKVFVTVDKLCKTFGPNELNNEHKHLEELKSRWNALHKQEREQEIIETYNRDIKNDLAKGIYNTYDVLPPLTSSTQHFSSYNEYEEEEQSDTENLANTHASNVDTRHDISHGKNKTVSNAKRIHNTNKSHQHHTSERNPFDIAIADKASIPGPGTYDLMAKSNEKESMLHLSSLETIITAIGAPLEAPSSSSLKLRKEWMQHSKSRSASYPSFTFAQSQRNQNHWNNPLTERHTDKYAELYSPGPGSYDITMYESAFDKDNKNNSNANSTKEVVYADKRKEQQEWQKTTPTTVVTNTNTIIKHNNITTNSNKKKTRQYEKTVNHKVKQNEKRHEIVHETSPGPGMYDIDTASIKNMVTRTHSTPAWTIRNTRYDVHDDKTQQYHADRQIKKENQDKINNSRSNNFEINNNRPIAEHHHHNMLNDVSPGPLTYDPQKYIEGNTRSTFSKSERWGIMQKSSDNDNKNKITTTTSSSFDKNISQINLGNVYNQETEYMSVPGPGAYDPYPTSEKGKPNVRETKSNNKNNVDVHRVSKMKEELRRASNKINPVPGPATYYPSYDITLTHPPRTIFASNINPQLDNNPITMKSNKTTNKIGKESILQNGEETRKTALGPGMYDIDMSKLYHTRGGVINKSLSSSSMLPEHCLGINRTRDIKKENGQGEYDVDYNNINKNSSKLVNNIYSERKITESVNKQLCPLDDNCIRDEHLLGPGSYDTLYSYDNIKAHTPGVVMRSASVEKVNSMIVGTYNDNNIISNNNKKCKTEDLGPGMYDVPYSFTIKKLQKTEKNEKNEVQQELSLKSKHEKSYFHSKPNNVKTYIDNTQNNTRQVALEHWHHKPDKEIVDTPGPGTYYLNTAPIIHSVPMFNEFDHKFDRIAIGNNNNISKQSTDHMSMRKVSTETVHSTDYFNDDAGKITKGVVERTNSIQQMPANASTNINFVDEDYARNNHDTLQTNHDQLQETQHNSKYIDYTTGVSTRAREELQTTKAIFNTEVLQQEEQQQRNLYKKQETSVSGPGMYDSTNTQQQHFGANTGTTFNKAARFTNTMHIPYSEFSNNNKFRNCCIETLPGPGSYATDDYNHDFLPLNKNNNSSSSKCSAQNYNMNRGNINDERNANRLTTNRFRKYSDDEDATHDNNYTRVVNKNKSTLQMQHSIEFKSKEQKEEEQESQWEVFHNQAHSDETTEFLPVPEVLKVVQVPHNATSDNESDSSVQNAIGCENDSWREYLHQHVFIRPLDDDVSDSDKHNDYCDDNNHDDFVENNRECLQTLHSQAYPLRETNVKKKRVRFALDTDLSSNNDNDDNARAAAAAHSMEMSTQRNENTEITLTPISEIALNRLNVSLQIQQDKELQPERVINMSPELIQEIPENKIGQEHLPYNSNINLCTQEQSTDAASNSIIHTPWKQELLQQEEKQHTTNAALPAYSLNRTIYNAIQQDINTNNMLYNKEEHYTHASLQNNPMPDTNTFSSPYSNEAEIDTYNPNTNRERVYYNTAVNDSGVKDDKQDFEGNMTYARLQIPYYTPQDDATTLAKLAQFGYPVV